MLAYAFIATQRAEHGDPDLPPFPEVCRAIVQEAAFQRLMDKHGFNRKRTKEVAVDMLRGFSEWG